MYLWLKDETTLYEQLLCGQNQSDSHYQRIINFAFQKTYCASNFCVGGTFFSLVYQIICSHRGRGINASITVDWRRLASNSELTSFRRECDARVSLSLRACQHSRGHAGTIPSKCCFSSISALCSALTLSLNGVFLLQQKQHSYGFSADVSYAIYMCVKYHLTMQCFHNCW